MQNKGPLLTILVKWVRNQPVIMISGASGTLVCATFPRSINYLPVL